jgi:hypothetical protein
VQGQEQEQGKKAHDGTKWNDPRGRSLNHESNIGGGGRKQRGGKYEMFIKLCFGFSVFRFKNSKRRVLIKQQRAP